LVTQSLTDATCASNCPVDCGSPFDSTEKNPSRCPWTLMAAKAMPPGVAAAESAFHGCDQEK
jgi:hypothetical protein